MKIPIVTAQTDIPSTIPGTASAGMEYEALGNLGGQFQKLALQISDEEGKIRAKFKEANNLLTLNAKVSDILNFTQKVDKELDETPGIDPMDRQKVYLERANAQRDELLKDIPDDLLRKRAELELNKNILVSGLKQGEKGRKKADEQVEATTEAQMLEFANKGEFGKVRTLADYLVNKGLRTPKWANELVDKYTEIGEKALIHTKYASDDLETLRGLKTEIDAASKMSLLEKAIYKGEVQNKITRLEEKQKREEKEAAATNVYNDLKATYGEDYDLALKALSNPDYSEILQKKYKIDLAGLGAVRTAIHNEKVVKESETKAAHEKTAAENFVNIDAMAKDSVKGLATINQQVKDNLLDWKVGEHFKNVILNPPEVKSDPGEYLSILKDLAMDRDKDEITGRILSSTKLSLTDKKALGQELYRTQAGENKDWISRARQFLESQIIPKFGMLEKIARTPKEEAAYYNAIKALDEKLEAAKKSGKPIEGQDILTLAQSIVPIYQRPIADAIVERAREQERAAENIKTKMDRERVIKDKAKKYKTDKEVSEDYNSGKLSYEDADAILKFKFGAK